MSRGTQEWLKGMSDTKSFAIIALALLFSPIGIIMAGMDQMLDFLHTAFGNSNLES